MRKEKKNVYLCSYSSMIPSCFLPWNSHPEEYHWAAGSFQYLLSSSAISFPLRRSYFPYSCSCWSLLLERGSTPPKSYFLLWGVNAFAAHVSVHKVFYELWHPGLHLFPVWGCLSNWSVSLLTTASSIFTAQSRIWHVTGIRETSVQQSPIFTQTRLTSKCLSSMLVNTECTECKISIDMRWDMAFWLSTHVAFFIHSFNPS